MKIQSLAGTAEEARRLQETNGVPMEFRGPWYHGTNDRQLQVLTNKGPKLTWFTRSPAGGIPWGPNVLVMHVIQLPDAMALVDAGAGDPQGMDPQKPGEYLPNWWLRVPRAEIGGLMIVSAIDNDKLDEAARQTFLTDEFYLDLKKRLSALKSGKAGSQ